MVIGMHKSEFAVEQKSITFAAEVRAAFRSLR